MNYNEYFFKEGFRDSIRRVVWLVGRVNKNDNPNSTLPLVDIWFVELDKFDTPIENHGALLKIPASELDTFKVGTIWKGSQKTTKLFKLKNESLELFHFDSDNLANFETIKRSEKINIDGNVININQGGFNLWRYLPKNQEQRASVTSYSLLTILKSNCGADVLIPSLELFTSTYTPKSKQIRNDLLNFSLVDVVNKYVKKKAVIGETANIFYLEPEKSVGKDDLPFLAHAALNIKTRIRLSRIYPAVQTGTDLYIYPYHIKKMDIKCEGTWLDIKKTKFLVIRITGCSLPDEYEIKTPKDIYSNHAPEDKNKPTDSAPNFRNKKNTTPSVTNERDPNKRINPTYHRSNVEIIGERPVITYINRYIENDAYNEASPTILDEEVHSTSPGEGNYSNGSNGVSQLRIDDDEKIKILPSEFLVSINRGITECVGRNEPTFCKVEYYDQYGNASNTLKYGNIAGNVFLLVKVFQIYRRNPIKTRSAFVLEFDRIKGNSGCQGLAFNTETGSLSPSLLVSVLNKIKENDFRYKNKNTRTQKMVSLKLPLKKMSIFKHTLNSDKFEENYVTHLLSKLKYQWHTEK